MKTWLEQYDEKCAEAAKLREALEKLVKGLKGTYQGAQVMVGLSWAETALAASSGEWLERHDADSDLKIEKLQWALLKAAEREAALREEPDWDHIITALRAWETGQPKLEWVEHEQQLDPISANELEALLTWELEEAQYATIRISPTNAERLILGLRLLEEHERHHGPVAPGTGTVLAGPGGGTSLPGAKAG